MSGERRAYRNMGAPFRTADGSRVARGDTFYPTPQELARRKHKLRPVDGGPVDPSELVAHSEAGAPIAESGAPPAQFAGFDRTRFADDAAHALAVGLGLSDMTFEGQKGTGAGGALTEDDVRALVGEPRRALPEAVTFEIGTVRNVVDLAADPTLPPGE